MTDINLSNDAAYRRFAAQEGGITIPPEGVICPRCFALPDEFCHAPNGGPARQTHVARIEAEERARKSLISGEPKNANG